MLWPVPRQVPSVRRRKPPTPAQAARIRRRQLERSVCRTVGERLRWAWHALRMTLREIDYASYCLLDCRVPLPPDYFEHTVRGRTRGRSEK